MTQQIMHRRSRKIEYLEEEYLLKQMGISKNQIPIYILKELLDNGIDADEDNGLEPMINVWFNIENKTLKLSIKNRADFPEKEIDNILDLDNYYGTKHYRKYLKRGAQGNALKTIIGYCSTQNKTVKLQINNKIHEIGFVINDLDIKIIHNIITSEIKINGTKISLEFEFDGLDGDEFTNFIDNYVLCNQNVQFKIRFKEQEISYNKVGDIKKYNKKDNIQFYNKDNFRKLILAEQDLYNRTKQRLSIINFCKRFDSLSSNRITKKLIKEINVKWIDELTEEDYNKLYENMIILSKKFNPKNLGEIGKETFKKRLEDFYGIELSEHDIKYKKIFCEDNGVPFVIEGFSLFHENIKESKEHFYINNTPTYDLPDLENVNEINEIKGVGFLSFTDALGYYNVGYDTPIHSMFHVYCPNITFRDYGKSDFVIGDNKNFGESMVKVIHSLFSDYYKQSKRKRKDSELMRKYAEEDRKQRKKVDEEKENSKKYSEPKYEENYTFEELLNASEGELRYWFKSNKENQLCNKKALIRAVLISYAKHCKKLKLEPVILRTRIWYGAIKPILSRAEPSAITGKTKYSGVTSNILSDLVQEGKVSYDDYQVFDESRKKRLTSKVYDEIILFVEKNGAYSIIEKLANVYDIKLFAGGGYSGTLAVWELVKYIKQNETDKKKFVILMGDYDPHGFRICKDFINTIKWMGLNVDYERLGINPEHISKKEIETAKYILKKDKNMTEEEYTSWCNNYAIKGDDGEYYGLEMEAITEPYVLRKIVVDKLIKLCNPHILYNKIMKEQMNTLHSDVTDSLLSDLNYILNDIGLNIMNKEKKFDRRKTPKKSLLPELAIKGKSLEITNQDNHKRLKLMVIEELKKYNFDFDNLTKQLKNRKK